MVMASANPGSMAVCLIRVSSNKVRYRHGDPGSTAVRFECPLINKVHRHGKEPRMKGDDVVMWRRLGSKSNTPLLDQRRTTDDFSITTCSSLDLSRLCRRLRCWEVRDLVESRCRCLLLFIICYSLSSLGLSSPASMWRHPRSSVLHAWWCWWWRRWLPHRCSL